MTTQITMLSIDAKTLTSDLERAGYRKMGVSVRSAPSYEDAAKILTAESVDIIVVNMDYKKIDALEVTRHLKEIKQWQEIPVVVTSVQAAPKIRSAAIKAGADLFVEQPVPREYFIEKVKSLLDQKTRTTERVVANVEVSFKCGGKAYTCKVGDMSVTGILLSTDVDFPQGENIEMTFILGASSKSVRVNGEIVRRIEASHKYPDRLTGVGVRFVEFIGDAQQRIESWIARTSDTTNKMVYYL